MRSVFRCGGAVVVVEESDEKATEFAAAQRALTLGFVAVDQIPWRLEALEHVRQHEVERKVQDGIKSEEDFFVTYARWRAGADVAVDGIVAGDQLAEEAERALAETVGVLAHLGTEAGNRQRAEVLDGIHPEAVPVRLPQPVAVCQDEGVDQCGGIRVTRIIKVIVVILEREEVALLGFREGVEVPDLPLAVVEILISQFRRDRAVASAEAPEWELLVLEVEEVN